MVNESDIKVEILRFPNKEDWDRCNFIKYILLII